ncbi:hypothetical protein D3C72_1657720 [compost metagenome]
MGRAAMFWPPLAGLFASGAPSMATTWPLPVSATKPIPDRAPLAPVQVTVHSIASLQNSTAASVTETALLTPALDGYSHDCEKT